MAEERNESELAPMMDGEKPKRDRSFSQEVEVAGNQLVDRIKSLIQEGNVRRLIIRDQEGRTLLEVPLTIGAAAGGVLLVFAPLWAGLGAIGALLMKVRLEVVRELGPDDPAETNNDITIS